MSECSPAADLQPNSNKEAGWEQECLRFAAYFGQSLGLAFPAFSSTYLAMALPTEPVTLTPEQLAHLNGELSTMRHDINNHLSLIMAAVELIRHKPHMAERMMATLVEQPPRITESLKKFSVEFAETFGLSPKVKG